MRDVDAYPACPRFCTVEARDALRKGVLTRFEKEMVDTVAASVERVRNWLEIVP